MTDEIIRVPATPAGPALVLRRWTDRDADSLIEVYRDPAIHHFVRTSIKNTEEAAAWLATRYEGWRTNEHLSFAVDDDEHKLVACVVLKRPHADPEIGYWTAAPARGRGVATRIVNAISTWAFARYGMDHIQLKHQVDNVASCRVAEKAGYVYETTLPPFPPYPLDGHLHVRKAT